MKFVKAVEKPQLLTRWHQKKNGPSVHPHHASSHSSPWYSHLPPLQDPQIFFPSTSCLSPTTKKVATWQLKKHINNQKEPGACFEFICLREVGSNANNYKIFECALIHLGYTYTCYSNYNLVVSKRCAKTNRILSPFFWGKHIVNSLWNHHLDDVLRILAPYMDPMGTTTQIIPIIRYGETLSKSQSSSLFSGLRWHKLEIRWMVREFWNQQGWTPDFWTIKRW